MVAEQSAESMADMEQTPLPEEVETSGGGVGAMESMIRGLQAQIQALGAQLSAKVNVNFDDPHKLKPIDVKDIEKPDKYDNNIAKFTIWYARLRDLFEQSPPELGTRVQCN